MEQRAIFDLLYREELASLRDAGAALAARQPQLAARLAGPSDDPDVERLLQGAAFVATRLRQRIEAMAPELVEALLAMVLPNALRPLPAATVVAFRRARPCRGLLRIARGTPLSAREHDGTRCTFTSTRELLLPPVSLTSITLSGADPTPVLTLRLRSEGEAPWPSADAPLRLYLHGDEALTEQLGLWLTRHLRRVSARPAEGAPDGDDVEVVLGGAETVRRVGLDPDDALLPWPTLTPDGTRLLEEWFALPAKHRFFDVHGLERAAAHTRGEFLLALQFERPPPLPARLPEDLVRLHCVPAVNLFDVDAEPLRVDLRERPVLLRAAGLDPAHMEVFDVGDVTGLRPGGVRVAYGSAYAPGLLGTSAGRYAISRRLSPIDGGIHTYLTLHRNLAGAREAVDETLSIALRCSNRDLPRALGIGDLCTPSAAVPAEVSFTNIAPIAGPRRPPLGTDRMWPFVALLACGRHGLRDAATLRGWLALHAGRGAPVDDPRIAAIRSVSTSPVTRAQRGAVLRGVHHRVALDRSGFVSEGAAYAFGALLHRLLDLDASVNAFADLTVALAPDGPHFAYLGAPA